MHAILRGMRAITLEHMRDAAAPFCAGELRFIGEVEGERRLVRLERVLACVANDCVHVAPLVCGGRLAPAAVLLPAKH